MVLRSPVTLQMQQHVKKPAAKTVLQVDLRTRLEIGLQGIQAYPSEHDADHHACPHPQARSRSRTLQDRNRNIDKLLAGKHKTYGACSQKDMTEHHDRYRTAIRADRLIEPLYILSHLILF